MVMISLREWALTPEFLEDELLSSWLCRTALKHAQSPCAFWLSEHHSSQIKRDIDVFQPKGFLEFISKKTNVPVEILRAHTLERFTRIFTLNPVKGSQWVTRTGSSAPSRLKHGLTYCPLCFQSSAPPHFKLYNRLAWVTVCPVHKTILRDACPHCGAPVGPLWTPATTGRLGLCHNCLNPLSACKAKNAHKSVDRFQSFLTEWLSSPTGQLDLLRRLLLDGLRGVFIMAMPLQPKRQSTKPSAETLSVNERYTSLHMVAYTLMSWPDRLIALSKKQRSLFSVMSHLGRHPSYLNQAVVDATPYSRLISSEEIKWADKHLIHNLHAPSITDRKNLLLTDEPRAKLAKTPALRHYKSSLLSESEAQQLIDRTIAADRRPYSVIVQSIYHEGLHVRHIARGLGIKYSTAYREISHEINHCSPVPFVTPGKLKKSGHNHRNAKSIAAAKARQTKTNYQRWLRDY